ncbi:MAG: tetratricopeptide repeat protein [Promethearchaeota archaeon]
MTDLTTIESKNAKEWNDMGELYAAKKEYDSAIFCFDKALKLKNSAQIWINKGNVYYETKEYFEAIKCYEEALTIDPNNNHIVQYLGNLYTVLKDYDLAYPYYEKATQINPNDPLAWNNLGNNYRLRNKYSKAIKCLEKAIKLNPNNPEIWNSMGKIYADIHISGNAISGIDAEKAYHKSIELFEKVIKIDSNFNNARSNLGEIYFYKNELNKAIEYFNAINDYDNIIKCYLKILDVNLIDTDAWSNIGKIYIKKNELDSAIECFKKILVIDPTNLTAKNDLKEAYKLKATNSTFPKDWTKLGNKFFTKEDYNRASKYYSKALNINPNYKDALRQMGEIYRKQQRYDRAIEYFQKILKIDPNDVKTLIKIGFTYNAKEENDRAIEYFSKAIKLDPNIIETTELALNNANIWNLFGTIFLKVSGLLYRIKNNLEDKQRVKNAIECFKKAIDLDPTLYEAWHNLGMIFYVGNEFNKALYYFENIHEYEKMIECYKKLVEINPEDIPSWNKMGKIYENLKDLENAKKCYIHARKIERKISHIKSFEKVKQKVTEKIDPGLVVEVRNLTKTYSLGDHMITALNKVNLKIKKGEYIAIVGPSGSGKSTLIHCIGALDIPDSGQIIYNIDGDGTGSDIVTMKKKQQKEMRLNQVGLIFQFFNLLPIFTAYENVELPMLLEGHSREVVREKVEDLLKKVNLEKRMHHKPTELSGGEQQRVAIARSIANEPLILLADEPTGELDTESSIQVVKTFLDLKNTGHSILMVTHDNQIAETADRILTLTDGKFTEERKGGKPLEELWTDLKQFMKSSS